ncbi:hypothetical protein [Tichowtungia aerotolerans]|uniref:Uncharacterized protein n=1 Tax=Tichowtungia aerotolerans TaxID=2697043 RepID=A0A6P1MCM2_9BACT|nr:hypothetical protein [Tichowtungia aerotolerans]QHI70324.1 hypothetical protein GT409_13025 [Tichowtungia aerotolerans]
MKAYKFAGLFVILTGFMASSYSAVVTNWVQDSDFELLSLSTAPNVNTSPWVAQESSAFGVQREDVFVHSGTNAVAYQYYFNTDQIYQFLPEGLTIDSSVIYEARFWMRLDEKSTNVAHTNESLVQVMISTTTNGVHGSTYVWKTSEYGLIPSAPYQWEEMVVHFRGSDLSDREGEYIRLAIKNSNAGCEYRVFIDDVQFGVYTPDTPDSNVLIGYYGAGGGTNDYTAAGIGGAVFLDKAYQLNANGGSDDGTFGSTNVGASLEYSAYEVRIGSDPVSNINQQVGFKIVNNTGAPLQLDSISFDYAPWWAESPQDVDLLYTWGSLGGISNDAVINSTSGMVNLGANKGDYYDFDWSLTGLPDRVLADGETAAFALKASNASGIWASGAFDNIAILGGAYEGAGYEAWAVEKDLIGGPTDDDDGDGIDNLTEYAQNGDPNNAADTGTSPAMGMSLTADGTNWIEYVYLKRVSSDNGLTYALVQNQDLVSGTWTNHGDIVEVGESAPAGDFSTVTNHVPTDGKAQEFIRLLIEAQ